MFVLSLQEILILVVIVLTIVAMVFLIKENRLLNLLMKIILMIEIAITLVLNNRIEILVSNYRYSEKHIIIVLWLIISVVIVCKRFATYNKEFLNEVNKENDISINKDTWIWALAICPIAITIIIICEYMQYHVLGFIFIVIDIYIYLLSHLLDIIELKSRGYDIDKIGFGNESILGYEWIIKMRVCELVAGVIIYFLRNLIANKVCFIVVLASLLFSFFVECIVIPTYVFKRCKKTNRNIAPFITYIYLLICNILITLFFNIKV